MSPSPEAPSSSPPPKKRRFRLVAGLFLAGSLGGGLWWGNRYVEQELAPAIAKDLSKTLNRPVELGSVTGYSLSHIRIGPSRIPPHQQTRNGQTIQDADTVTVEAVEAKFNLWQTLWTRTLGLKISLTQPHLYVDQNREGQWLKTELQPPEDSGSWLKTEVKAVQFRQGHVTVQPWQKSVRQLHPLNGTLTVSDDILRLNASGQLDSGGQTTLKAEWQQPEQHLKLWADTQDLEVTPLLELVPKLPLKINAGRVSGQIRVETQPDQPLALTYKGDIEAANTDLPDDISIQAQRLQADLRIKYRPKILPQIIGTVKARNANLWIPEDQILDNERSRRQHFRRLNGTLKFVDTPQQAQFDLRGSLAAGGQLRVKGAALLTLQNQKNLTWRQANLLVQTRNLNARILDQAYDLPIRFRTGRANTNLRVRLFKGRQPSLLGVAQLRNVAGQIEGLPQPFSQANGRLRFRGLTTRFENTTALYGKIPLRGQGWIDPKRGFNLTAQTQTMEANLALGELGVTQLPFPVQGRLKARNIRVTGALKEPVLTGEMIAPGTTLLDQVPFDRLTAQFRLQASVLTINNILGTPTPGGRITGAARYDLSPGGQVRGRLQAQEIPGDAVAQFYNADPGFAIGPVQGPITLAGPPDDVETRVQFEAMQGEFPTRGQVIIRDRIARLDNVVARLPGGNLNINGRIDIPQDRVQATVTMPGITLAAYDPNSRGKLSGQFLLTAPFSTFSLANAKGLGQIRFSEGINLIQDPITAQVGWNGRDLLVQQATAPNFVATGRVGVDVDGPEGLQLTTLNLNLLAQNYDLRKLDLQTPPQIPLQGLANLRGQLTGTVAAPNLQANLRVNQFAAAQLNFESSLSGPLRYRTEEGLDLRLDGGRDRVYLSFGPDQVPRSFDIKRDQAIARGRPQGNELLVTLRQFPLDILNLQAGNTGTVTGLASGDFTANVRAAAVRGQFMIDRPGVGKLLGTSLAGSLDYANGVATLTNTDLAYRDSRYRLTATVIPGNNLQASGQIDVLRGQLADLWSASQILSLETPTAWGTAADVTTVPVGLPNASLYTQLQRLAEIETLMAQQQEQEEEASPLPPIAELEGQLTGRVQFQGSVVQGFGSTFDLKSGPIEWGPYSADQVLAQGQWRNPALTFDALQIISGTSVAKFQGQVGGQQQGGKLTLANIPVDPLNQLLDLPFQVSGSLAGAATLDGTLENPQIDGRFALTDAAVNTTPVQQAQADLTYRQGRLQFDGSANISSPDPIVFTGDIPYQLPFATVAPDSDRLEVKLAVRDQGLSVLNLFTDQVAWIEGKGNLDVLAQGTLAQPQVTGNLQVSDATIAAQALDESLTNVTGDVRFERDRIVITDTLTGTYSQGLLSASGRLPLYAQNASDRLQVSLRDLDLNLKGLYRGQIGGDLIVTGTALEPQLGGGITLAKGQVVLPETGPQTGSQTPGSSPTPVSETLPLQFNNLRVTVSDTVRVSQPPLLSFSASGDVILNGSIDNLRPQGTLSFRRGTVNLFTSRFRLDGRRENYAQFTPQYGLDPYLDIGMVTTVTDGVASRLSNLNEGVALQVSPVGNIESVRVRASVDGRASELARDFSRVVELDSTPSRTEGEIFALLGGGVTESLEEGNTQQALVNLASTAALTGFESLFDDVVGSRGSFRVFPVLIPNEDDRTRSTLEFGAEVGYDITDRFSASVLQIVSDLDEPTLFNLNYELNDQLRVRTAIGTDGEAVGILEYRIRF